MEKINVLNEYFDKIYCINLVDNIDRKKHAIKQFNRLGIDVEFFDAVRYGFGNIIARSVTDQKLGHLNKQSNNEFGCLISHYTIIAKSLSLGYNNILILEDDICFKNDFNDIIKTYIDEIPNDAEVLKFYGCCFSEENYNSLNHDINKKWNKNKLTWSSMMYGLSKSGMLKLKNVFDKYVCAADMPLYLSETIGINTYATNIPLALPNKNFASDIQINNIAGDNEITDMNYFMRITSLDDYAFGL